MIKVVNKLNRDKRSLTTIYIDDLELALTENQLEELIRSLDHMREDLFTKYSSDLLDRIEILEEENEELRRRIDDFNGFSEKW